LARDNKAFTPAKAQSSQSDYSNSCINQPLRPQRLCESEFLFHKRFSMGTQCTALK